MWKFAHGHSERGRKNLILGSKPRAHELTSITTGQHNDQGLPRPLLCFLLLACWLVLLSPSALLFKNDGNNYKTKQRLISFCFILSDGCPLIIARELWNKGLFLVIFLFSSNWDFYFLFASEFRRVFLNIWGAGYSFRFWFCFLLKLDCCHWMWFVCFSF